MVKRFIYVVDSSVIVKWITSEKENYLEQADQLLQEAQATEGLLAVPLLAKYEVGNVIKYKSFSLAEKITCLENLYHLPLHFFDSTFKDSSTTMEIAQSSDITYYDAAFISHAQKLLCPHVTANPKHQQKFPGVKVIPLKDYK